MFRIAFVCFVFFHTSLSMSAGADDLVPSPLARWKAEIVLQLDAAQAELTIQEQIFTATKERYRLGDVSKRELHSTRESQRRAMEWVELLQSEATTTETMPVTEGATTETDQILLLRVPGVPLLFASESFAWIEVPQTRQVLRIVDELQYLDQELHDICLSDVQTEVLQSQIDRLRTIQPETSDARSELASLILHLKAARLEPERLVDVLSCTVLSSRLDSGHEHTASSPVPSVTMMAVAERWTKQTRQILLAQTIRTLEQLQQRQTLMSVSSPDGRSGEHGRLALQHEIDMQQLLSDSLRRDLAFLLGRGAHQSQTVSTHSSSSAGYFMRLMKQQWEQLRGDGEHVVKRELLVAETELKYAMELYRLESGRSNDPAGLLEQRMQLFALAADLRVEQADLNTQLDAARQQEEARQNHSGGDVTPTYDEHASRVHLRRLELLQQRQLLQLKRAKLCLKLARLANDRQAVAQYEN